MKPRPFRFRLARVVRVRELEEEIQRGAWGAAEQDALREEQRLADARAGLAEACRQLARGEAGGRLVPGEVLAADQLLELRRIALTALAQRAAAAREAAEARRLEWMESRQGLRSLELYRERALVAHREEVTRDEARAMDEVAATLSERRRRHDSRILPQPGELDDR